MTSTNAVRDALADLAEAAPAVNAPRVADSALRAAGSRRRRRRALLPVSLVVAAAFAWSLPNGPLDGDAAPIAPAGASAAYDPNIETPWHRLGDLPMRLDEPLAFSYTVLGGDQRVVSASGGQWTLPDGHPWVTPSIAPDGRKVAWYDGSDQQLVVRDLAAGTERRIAATFGGDDDTVAITPNVTPLWSPGGGRLALTSALLKVSIVDVDTGDVVVASGTAQAIGWRDDYTVVGLSQDSDALFKDVVELTADGSRVMVGSIQLDGLDDPAPLVVSPDGSKLAGLVSLSTGTASVGSWELGPAGCTDCASSVMLGSSRGTLQVSLDQPPRQWVSDTELLVSVPSGSGQLFGAVDADTAAFRPLVVVSPRMGAVDLNVVPAVVAGGPAQALRTDRWWWGWYVDRIIYGGAGALLIALIVVFAAYRRRRSSR